VSWPRTFGRSVDREQVRSRILAFAGIWFLLAGFLWALGLSVVLFFSLVLLLVGGLLAGALWLERRYRVERAFVAGASSLERVSRRGKARLDELAPGEHLKRYANGASRRAQSFVETYQKKPEPAPEPVAVEVEVEVDRGGEAHRLNELGAQLRRDGDHDGAVEQHLAALAMVREVGDRRAEALTLNNLALALVHTNGGVPMAVQNFEQSLALLRELGDDELEGQVIANLGFLRRRQGRDDDAETLLHEALDKLPPESSAYRHVEEQLRRAS